MSRDKIHLLILVMKRLGDTYRLPWNVLQTSKLWFLGGLRIPFPSMIQNIATRKQLSPNMQVECPPSQPFKSVWKIRCAPAISEARQALSPCADLRLLISAPGTFSFKGLVL